jgi:uncharacterized protein
MDKLNALFTRRRFMQAAAAVGVFARHPLSLGSGSLEARALAEQNGTQHRDYALFPLALADVDISDEFWSPRIEKARTVSLPLLLDYARNSGERFEDGRLIEAASYFLMKKPDPALQQQIEPLLDPLMKSVSAQRGVWRNVDDGPFFWTGHFFEAAIAYRQATGKKELLGTATALADDLADVYGPGKRTDISNHEGIELALVKLYRETGNDKYLRLAQFIFDVRGTTAGGRKLTGSYAQDHEPVKDQRRAIGHCVRGTYLYCALTDLAALNPDPAYGIAAHSIWNDAVSKRTYLTGGIGSYRREEDFGDDYDLPNLSCWNEICAAVGNTLWNRRMLQLTRDSQYADVMERILYNGLLAGVSLEGDKFLYQAPLKAFAGFERQARFGPNCCPPNITRLLAQLGTLVYFRDDARDSAGDAPQLYVNLFIGSKARFAAAGKTVEIAQETKYPWDGQIKFTVTAQSPARLGLNLRIPSWASGKAMPGSLYEFDAHEIEAANDSPVDLLVNGRKASYQMNSGYARLDREWANGDVVELSLPMKVQTVRADTRVKENTGMVALARGPIVYCAEGLDNAGGVFDLVVPSAAKLEFTYRSDLLGGTGTVHGRVERLSRSKDWHNKDSQNIESHAAELVAIPYSTFGNRGETEMAVWLARDAQRAMIPPALTLASSSVASSSCGDGTVAENYPGHTPPTVAKRMYPLSQDGSGHISAIYDQAEPIGSEDGSGAFLRLRPQSGSHAWVQYDFPKPSRVSSVSVYWKDDKQFCVAPSNWRLMYKEGDSWKAVAGAGEFKIETDSYNSVQFTPVETSALRLEIELQAKTYKKGKIGPPDANYLAEDLTWYEGGVIEWKVNG